MINPQPAAHSNNSTLPGVPAVVFRFWWWCRSKPFYVKVIPKPFTICLHLSLRVLVLKTNIVYCAVSLGKQLRGRDRF